MNIEGKYKIKIFKAEEGGYLATCKCKQGSFVTQGDTKQEIFEMIADAFMTMYDVEVK